MADFADCRSFSTKAHSFWHSVSIDGWEIVDVLFAVLKMVDFHGLGNLLILELVHSRNIVNWIIYINQIKFNALQRPQFIRPNNNVRLLQFQNSHLLARLSANSIVFKIRILVAFFPTICVIHSFQNKHSNSFDHWNFRCDVYSVQQTS